MIVSQSGMSIVSGTGMPCDKLHLAQLAQNFKPVQNLVCDWREKFMKNVRIGLIGCGFYAQNHMNAWKDLAGEGAVLVAVCDVDPVKAAAAGAQFGVPHYVDAKAMLDCEQIDLVDIATRQDTHRALCELTIARRIPTIVQKPFAPTWEDCIAIVSAAEKASVWLAVHENFRYQTPMRNIARTIASGAIGKPNWGRFAFRTHFDVFKTQPYFYDEERLAISDVGVHVLDLARFFMGEVTRISCETQRRFAKVRAEDTATMMLRHDSGAVSLVECTYLARRIPDPFPETLIEIEGEKGSIIVRAGCKMTVTSDNLVWEEDIAAPLKSWTSFPWHVSQEGSFGACRHFLHCIQEGKEAETKGSDNLRTYALVDAAYEAADQAKAVTPRRYLPAQ
jgi:D-apiose dehydrogenase